MLFTGTVSILWFYKMESRRSTNSTLVQNHNPRIRLLKLDKILAIVCLHMVSWPSKYLFFCRDLSLSHTPVMPMICSWHQLLVTASSYGTSGPTGQWTVSFFYEHWFGIVNQIREGNHIKIYLVMKNFEISVYFNYFITVREMQWIILFKNKRQHLYVYFSVS